MVHRLHVVLWTEDKVFVRVDEVGTELAANLRALAANLRALPEPAVIIVIAMGVFLFFTNIC
jgi:hypoxanthine phosphoribosyltransferase